MFLILKYFVLRKVFVLFKSYIHYIYMNDIGCLISLQMKRYGFLLFLLLVAIGCEAQNFVLKTDLPAWATASINIEPEFRLAPRHTLALGVSYNAWDINKTTNMKWRHIFVQPEYRYWTCSAFNGHFIATHVAYMHYNIGGLKNNLDLHFAQMLNERRFQGDYVSIGVGYGYHWMITSRFSMEAELGLGAAWTAANSYKCEVCGDYLGRINKWFFTPTKLSVSFIWLIF